MVDEGEQRVRVYVGALRRAAVGSAVKPARPFVAERVGQYAVWLFCVRVAERLRARVAEPFAEKTAFRKAVFRAPDAHAPHPTGKNAAILRGTVA